MKFRNRIFIILICSFLFSCEKAQTNNSNEIIQTSYTNEHFIEQDVFDPFEGLNRRIYYFNSKLDKYFLLPVSNVYSTYTPKFIRKGIHNFFLNLEEVPIFINSTLQFKGKKSITTLARFGINTTFGVLGIFDFASKIEIEKSNEDFGQTLGFYGIPSGPYIILPILGPSNLRDTTGRIINSYSLTYTDPLKLINYSQSDLEIIALDGIDTRSNLNFKYYGTGSAFEYDYIRFLYSKVQKLDIKK